MSQPLSRAKKIVLLSSLYVAQGLPYGFFTIALQILLRKTGLSLTAISALSLLYLPWAFKFLWAPYLDQLGSRKALLLTLQITAVLGALLLSQLDIDSGYMVVIAAAFVFNIVAASQDVVTDGLAVRLLDPRERGLGNGIQVGAYRVGMTLGAGFLLTVFDLSGWSTMFACMALLLAITVIPVLTVDGSSIAHTPIAAPRFRELAIHWVTRALAPGMIGFAALIFCFRYGDAIVSTLLGAFMSDQGLSTRTLGLMKGTVGNVTSILGAIIGGWFVFSVRRRTAVLVAGVGQALTFIPYFVASLGIGGVGLLWVATIMEGIVSTIATVALFTLMMDASDPEHAGTDYTLLASVYVLVGSIGQFSAAQIADRLGYPAMFTIGIALTVLGTLALVFTLDRRAVPARLTEVWQRR